MSSRSRSRAGALRLGLVISFALAWSFCGGRRVFDELRPGAIRLPQELHSCDLYLESATRRPHLAGRISAALRSLPPDKPIAILMHEEDPESSILGMVSAYLAWPHTIRIFRLENGPARLDRDNFAAVIYCKTPPPIGPTTSIVTLSRNFQVALPSDQ